MTPHLRTTLTIADARDRTQIYRIRHFVYATELGQHPENLAGELTDQLDAINALSPGDIVPCAVWDDDELMALRLRGDFGRASEFTLSQRVAGTEVSRATGQLAANSDGELIHLVPAAWVRQLPVVEVEILLTAHEGGEERAVGSYTLVHGGSLHR